MPILRGILALFYCSRNIVARGETIVTQLKMEGAMDARDALAKATYAGMLCFA